MPQHERGKFLLFASANDYWSFAPPLSKCWAQVGAKIDNAVKVLGHSDPKGLFGASGLDATAEKGHGLFRDRKTSVTGVARRNAGSHQ